MNFRSRFFEVLNTGFLLVALTLFSPKYARAADITQYSILGGLCANNGDGTVNACAGSPGGAGAFNSVPNWESQDLDLVGAGNNVIAIFSGTETAAFTVSGWTTDSTHTITMRDLTVDSSNYGAVVTLSQPFLTIQDCSISKGGGSLSPRLVNITGTYDGTVIERCRLFHNATFSNDGGAYMVRMDPTANAAFTLRNSFLYDSRHSAFSGSTVGGQTVSIDNNTFVGNTVTGLELGEDTPSALTTLNVRNNLSTGNGTDFDVSAALATTSFLTNVSSDSSSPNAAGDNKTITYVDVGAKDFHLDPTESDAIDLGTSLAGSFTTDIDSDTRPSGAAWDIGADEYVAPVVTATRKDLMLLGVGE